MPTTEGSVKEQAIALNSYYVSESSSSQCFIFLVRQEVSGHSDHEHHTHERKVTKKTDDSSRARFPYVPIPCQLLESRKGYLSGPSDPPMGI